VLRLTRPGLRLRTLLRSERHTLAQTLRTVVAPGRVLGSAAQARAGARGPVGPAAGMRSAPAADTRLDLAVVRAALAPATATFPARRLRTVLRTRVERERTLERITGERPQRDIAPATATATARPGRRAVRPPLVVRTSTVQAPPLRAAPPVSAEAREPALPAIVPAPQPAAVAPTPDLDELVDRILLRIERRAISQRERLGKA
jgi:hypothetical protein